MEGCESGDCVGVRAVKGEEVGLRGGARGEDEGVVRDSLCSWGV